MLTLFQAPQMMPKWFHSDNRDIQRGLEIGYAAKKGDKYVLIRHDVTGFSEKLIFPFTLRENNCMKHRIHSHAENV